MPAEQASVEVRRKAAREVIDILHEIATLLVCSISSRIKKACYSWRFQNTHLDRQQLSYCVSLIENGANPEALAVCSTLLAKPFLHACFVCMLLRLFVPW
jgi:mitotic-spindle organizing protein 1